MRSFGSDEVPGNEGRFYTAKVVNSPDQIEGLLEMMLELFLLRGAVDRARGAGARLRLVLAAFGLSEESPMKRNCNYHKHKQSVSCIDRSAI